MCKSWARDVCMQVHAYLSPLLDSCVYFVLLNNLCSSILHSEATPILMSIPVSVYRVLICSYSCMD